MKEWIRDNRIEEKTLQIFWNALSSYKKDSLKEFEEVFSNFNEKYLEVKIHSISLKIGNWPDCNYNHVIVYIPIIYKGNSIGYYELFFTLNGEIADDYFVIY